MHDVKTFPTMGKALLLGKTASEVETETIVIYPHFSMGQLYSHLDIILFFSIKFYLGLRIDLLPFVCIFLKAHCFYWCVLSNNSTHPTVPQMSLLGESCQTTQKTSFEYRKYQITVFGASQGALTIIWPGNQSFATCYESARLITVNQIWARSTKLFVDLVLL